MINDERWHGPIFPENSGSLNDGQNVSILKVFNFCKKRRDTNEKLKPSLERSGSFKNVSRVTLIDAILVILANLNEPIFKKYICDQNDFWILKEILQDYLPWKFQPQSFSVSWKMAASVFTLFEWSRISFWIIFCFLLVGQSPGVVGTMLLYDVLFAFF